MSDFNNGTAEMDELAAIDLLVGGPAAPPKKRGRPAAPKPPVLATISAVPDAPAAPKAKAPARGKADEVPERITIPALNEKTILVGIKGTAPVIVHQWAEKAIQQMLGNQTATGGSKKPKQREPKNPEADFQASRYLDVMHGWDGLPAVAFKAAMVAACRRVSGLTMVMAKTMFFVHGQGRTAAGYELVKLTDYDGIGGDGPRNRRDMVRLETGTADIRFRAEYSNWKAQLRIRFDANLMDVQDVVNLLSLAGAYNGVCEWRPSAPKSATGSHGVFEIDPDQEVVESRV